VVAFFIVGTDKGKVMEAGSTARVWKDGRLQAADKSDAALQSLCQAVERAMRDHQNAGVRAVILMVDQPSARPEPAVTPVPVYVDVFESGYSQDSGYGYGV
jgi:hypothetical protein